MKKKIVNFFKALAVLPEMYEEFQNLPKLVDTMQRLEKLLTGTADSPVQAPPLKDMLTQIDGLDEHKIQESYINTEKAKICDQALHILEGRANLIRSSPAVGTKEIKAKNAAIFTIEQEMSRLKGEKAKFTGENVVTVG